MHLPSDILAIASNNALAGIVATNAGIGNPFGTASLKSFASLTAADGVYYNKSLNVMVITKSGVTFDGYDFRGVSINVQADNVTIKNSTFDASVGVYSINALPGTKNLTIDHATFDGLKLDRTGYVDFVTSRGENTVITNSAFLDAPNDALSIQSGTISGNYIAGGGYASGAHSDGIWIPKTIGPVVITDNVIDWRPSADAKVAANNAVRITGEGGNVADVLVKNNVILGGSYSVLVADGATQTHAATQVGSVTGVRIVENVVDFGKYGDLEQTSRPKDMVYADNMHASGRPVAPGLEAVGTLPDLASLNKITAAAAGAAITGTAKGDYILGGTGSNYILGGAGNDVIVGGGGRDFITGGAGKDIFVYKSLAEDGTDRIGDFAQGQDRIDLATLAGAPKALADWQWLGTESFTGHAWQLRYTYASGITIIALDADGDLKADFKLELTGKIALDTSDFILVDRADLVSAPSVSDTKAQTVAPGFKDGIDLGALFSASFYSAANPDVTAAGVDPLAHYGNYGWHEGRDPNALFSTVGYLAANPDVAASGVNPLAHYDGHGWKEGRDPSAGFDNELYLARNPDVKAAGLDPLTHYLQYGQAEGRQAYAAVGKAADLAVHPGFDAEYYLLSNADVAKAAAAAGGDTFAFAYRHYEATGWHEGRNPNAVFDSKGYLSAYADVKAADIDPLGHYDQYGFKEGRDPSAHFDTKAYAAAYDDVKAAGLDPMLHFLQFGALEGRTAFDDGHFG